MQRSSGESKMMIQRADELQALLFKQWGSTTSRDSDLMEKVWKQEEILLQWRKTIICLIPKKVNLNQMREQQGDYLQYFGKNCSRKDVPKQLWVNTSLGLERRHPSLTIFSIFSIRQRAEYILFLLDAKH